MTVSKKTSQARTATAPMTATTTTWTYGWTGCAVVTAGSSSARDDPDPVVERSVSAVSLVVVSISPRAAGGVDRCIDGLSGDLRLRGDEPFRCGQPPGLDQEHSEQVVVDAAEIGGDPAVPPDVGGRAEGLRVELDEFGLRRRRRLDRDGITPLPADGEDLLADPEGDVGLPGHDLLSLRQGHRDRADVVEGRHRGRGGDQLGWLSIWARWSRPEKST